MGSTEVRGNRGLIRLPWRLIVGSAVILGAAFLPALSPLLAEGPYTVPAVSSVTTTEPLSQTESLCLVRSEPSGSLVPQRLRCYAAVGVAPPPPPPPFHELTHRVQVADFDAGTGQLSLELLPCTEFLPGFIAGAANQVIQLDKAGGPASGTITVTYDQTDPFDCVAGTDLTGPVTMTPLAQSHDDDIWGPNPGETGPDGCSTWEELGATASLGGLRDPFNFWDFYDAPTTGTPPVRDQMVNILDIGAIVARFGATGVSTIDPLSPPPPAPPYHPAFDRSSPVGPDLWNLGPADGVINIIDTGAAVAQFGHTCSAAP